MRKGVCVIGKVCSEVRKERCVC
ncbi:hypothetical protein Hamer_G021654 [Homarus americanus]|uniref:Uncharacterized protein n=1 Tax=Homarus americanus TaxID=6706 RepID=A0A8J5JMB8_HOMAM|nr:hypothetical protein Hamer_G021654 [Homarus americanus]